MSPPPVFVGGTGRSGTTVLADLIGQDSGYFSVPIEIRFHISNTGLFDALAGTLSVDLFLDRMKNEFFSRKGPDGKARGLHLIVGEDQLDEALEEFRERFIGDRFTAARMLIRRILDPLAAEAGKASWVEMTPGNVGFASKLVRLFPEMKLVHTVRDGRDVASSLVTKRWGPSTLVDGLYWWNERLREAEAERRMIDPQLVHVIKFDELMGEQRETAFRELSEFLGTVDSPGMRAFLDERMTRDKAHLGRWKRGLTELEASDVDGIYGALFDELVADGVRCLPIRPDSMAQHTELHATR